MVQLNDRLVDLLDEFAAREGLSRSAVIRRAIEEFLANNEQALVGRQIVDGYKRIPPATPDEWGEVQDVTNGATVDLLHRLDAEERARGHPAW